jgi:hypothetical protein
MRTQEEAEQAAINQLRYWRSENLSLQQVAEAIGSTAKDWDSLTIDAMRAYRDLFDRQDAMLDVA